MQYAQITVQKTFCLLGVIFFHTLLPFTTPIPFWKLYAAQSSAWADGLFTVANFTIIPSFIFASGFLLAKSRESKRGAVGALLGNRFKRLIVPWCMTMLFWLVPMYTLFAVPAYMHPAGTSLWAGYGLAVRGLFVDHLWFLLVLFWASLFWLICLPWVEKWGKMFGFVLALSAATLLQTFGQGLDWYCLRQTTGPLLYLYLGYLAYHSREQVDALLTQRAVPCLLAQVALVALCLPFAHHYLIFWFISCVSCVFTYQASLWTVRLAYARLQKNSVYTYFETNAFRYYLFHMPPALIVFMTLNSHVSLPPVSFILLSFCLTLAVTTAIVAASHALEKIPLYKILLNK